jgi:hyaluronoglucosaminidase
VIEGFYGPPWTQDARRSMIAFLAERGMNAYVYAPKSDEKHRERWREPYSADETAAFAELADASAAVGTRFGFAISPGLDIDYGSARDRALLVDKLAPLLDAGVDWFVLALDDIPTGPGLGSAQAGLVGWLDGALGGRARGLRLSVVPTEYIGTHPGPYLTELVAGCPPTVDLCWTGPTVCSPTITVADAQAWHDALGGRPLLLWDNFPVNDSVMEHELHLGPYRGRARDLADVVDGVLCNPMIQPRASLVPLATAADFLGDPATYDESASWERAISAVGGRRSGPLRALARACADSALASPEELPLHAMAVALADELDGPGWPETLARVRTELRDLRDAARAWDDAPEDPLALELAPWLAQARCEAEAGLAALRLLQQIRPVAVLAPDGVGRAAAPTAELALEHCFALMFHWSAAREASREVVLGPRFGLHAAVIQLADGRPALDVARAVREGGSVIDDLARLALDHYERWTAAPPGAVRVMADGQEVALDADGRFRCEPGAVVLVRAGVHATRVTQPDPPFRDPRLA